MKNIKVVRNCPMCDKKTTLKVDSEKYARYMRKEDLIQNIFNELNPAQREFIKTGYCADCQTLLFGTNYKI